MNKEKIDYWKPIISKWRESKKPRAKFCADNGLNAHTMAYWQAKIEAPPKPEAKFMNILETPKMELFFGDEVKLSIPVGSDPKWISECIKNLR